MGTMTVVRCLLVLLLTVAVDLWSPLPHHPAGEALDELEEVTHVRPGRRAFRPVRATVPPPVAHQIRAGDLQRPRALTPAPSRHAAAVVLTRKLPPSIAEPASAPEDH
jgi:hypothetical protein